MVGQTTGEAKMIKLLTGAGLLVLVGSGVAKTGRVDVRVIRLEFKPKKGDSSYFLLFMRRG